MSATRGSLRRRLVWSLVAVAGLAVLLAGAITLSLVRLIPERNLEQQLAGQVELLTPLLEGSVADPAGNTLIATGATWPSAVTSCAPSSPPKPRAP